MAKLASEDVLDASVAGGDPTAGGDHGRADVVCLDETCHDLGVVSVAIPINLALLEGIFALGFVQLAEWAHQFGEHLAHANNRSRLSFLG